MARLWKALVLVVALAVVPCEAHRPPRFEDIVDRAIEAYNNGRPGKPLFRLVDATQPSGQEERDCTVQFLRRGRSTYLTLSCDTDCSRQVSSLLPMFPPGFSLQRPKPGVTNPLLLGSLLGPGRGTELTVYVLHTQALYLETTNQPLYSKCVERCGMPCVGMAQTFPLLGEKGPGRVLEGPGALQHQFSGLKTASGSRPPPNPDLPRPPCPITPLCLLPLSPHPVCEGKTTGRLDTNHCDGGDCLVSLPQGAQVKDSPDYTVEDVSEKDQLKDLTQD
uniref:15 kDa protein A n=1 Tax=Cricetulus griseus TaxID=10029 RepID=A0A8C2M8A3_CRIGR